MSAGEERLAKQHSELIAKEGWVFFFPLVIFSLIAVAMKAPLWLSGLLIVLALYVAYFFRNPYRQIPAEPDGIICPADGLVVGVHTLEDGKQRINIFLNIFNVHVNRLPIGGVIREINYRKGKFMSAHKAEASVENERNAVLIDDEGFQVEVVQIAGLIARRIVCWIKPEDQVAKGERFGLIRFGSRVDITLPAGCEILVRKGQKVRAGSQLLARRPQTPDA